MKLLSALLAAALIPAPAALAATSTSALMGPIHQFIDNFNKGDLKAAAASHVADPAIIDEPAPHFWRGTSAFNDWAAALDKESKQLGDTEGKVTLGAVRLSSIEGTTGYVATDAVYSYHEKGKAMAEQGHFAFALRDGAGGWKIASWAWTGAKPHVVAVKAAAPAAAAKPAAAPAKPKT